MAQGTVCAMQSITPLKRILLAEGRKQSWLADRAGMDRAQLSRIVNGLHCDEATRERIAVALDRPVADLFATDASEQAA